MGYLLKLSNGWLRSEAEAIAAMAEALDLSGKELAEHIREEYPLDRICDWVAEESNKK
jgi:hypothetical protein